MLSRNTLRTLFWITAVTACTLLLLPGQLFVDVGLPRADLVVHLTMMAGVTALGIAAYERYRLPMVLGLGIIAILSEIVQIIVPYRYFDLTDLAANAVGITLGLIAGIIVTPIVLKKQPLAINR